MILAQVPDIVRGISKFDQTYLAYVIPGVPICFPKKISIFIYMSEYIYSVLPLEIWKH